MTILETLFPIIAIAFMAWCVAHWKFLSESETKTFEKIAFNFFVPCMLFYGTATADLPAVLDWDLLWGYYLGIFSIYLAGILIGVFFYGRNLPKLAAFGMGCAYPNAVVLGIPICLELLGDEAFVPIFMVVAIHNLLIFSFGIIVAEMQKEEGKAIGAHVWGVAKGLFKNPISGSLLLGAAINFSGIPLYQPVMDSMELLGRAGVPAAVMALGAGLNRYTIRGEIPKAVLVTLIKLLVQPALVWFFTGVVFEMDFLLVQTAVLLSCMPVGISVYVFTIRYRCLEDLAATSIVISCILSIISITLFAYLLGV